MLQYLSVLNWEIPSWKKKNKKTFGVICGAVFSYFPCLGSEYYEMHTQYIYVFELYLSIYINTSIYTCIYLCIYT